MELVFLNLKNIYNTNDIHEQVAPHIKQLVLYRLYDMVQQIKNIIPTEVLPI